jgi:hypothetical protein
MIHLLPFELLFVIFNALDDNRDKLKLIKSSKYFYNSLYFDSFSLKCIENVNLNERYLIKLTRLNMRGNIVITDLNHLTNLIELDIGHTNIDQRGIKKLTNLTSLNMYCNYLITDLNNLTNLTELDIRFTKISKKGIEKLTNLTSLNICGNDNSIVDLNHLINLT